MRLEVTMDDFQEALREVEPSAMREVFVEVPDVHWDDVGGLDEVKQRLIEAVEWPMKYPELFALAATRAAQGSAAVRPARLRQDAARQGDGHREPGELHLGQGAGTAVDVRGRIGKGRARGVPQGAAGGALHRLLRRDRRAGLGPRAAAARTRRRRSACSASC